MDNAQDVQNVQMQPEENTQIHEQTEKLAEQQNSNASESSEQTSIEDIINYYSQKTREELVEELQNLINKNDYEELKAKVPLLRNTYRNMPKPEMETEKIVKKVVNAQGEEEEQEMEVPKEDTTEVKFNELYNKYKEIRTDYQQKEEQQKEENLKKKQELLEELKKLLDSEQTLKEIYDQFNNIQEKWKEIGNVPHAEVNNLWESYHFLIEKFYEKVKINRELRDLDLKKNLEKKLILCEKVEELLIDEDINNSFAILQEYHRQWKEIGAVPTDKNDEVWERFKRASDAINQRRREFYEKRSEELEENKTKKIALKDQVSAIVAKELNTMKEWNEATEEIKNLFAQWKTIGSIPKADNETLWTQFKTMIDGFFEKRKEMFDKNKQTEEENYNKKIAICVRAEEIAKRDDFDAATKELKDLQEEWKHIGAVRKNLSDKIWLRFRAACDEFFNRKSESYLQTHQQIEENLQKKLALIEELKNYQFTEDKQENVNALKDFQKRWFEIGFLPNKSRKEVNKQWEEIIESNRDKLQISAEEIATKKGQKKAKPSIPIRAKIESLNEEINRLENNIGFFANSKNADLIKQEFEQKLSALRLEKQKLEDILKQAIEQKQASKEQEQTELISNEKQEENTSEEQVVE
ncbi:MAG: DUF349 domain-containing protein [Bacteroidota bacterium]|nr:DUF349 domain-containing protein [Bacteroidota bacterium]